MKAPSWNKVLIGSTLVLGGVLAAEVGYQKLHGELLPALQDGVDKVPCDQLSPEKLRSEMGDSLWIDIPRAECHDAVKGVTANIFFYKFSCTQSGRENPACQQAGWR